MVIQEGFEPPTHGLEELKINLYTIQVEFFVYNLQISITLSIYIPSIIDRIYFIATQITYLTNEYAAPNLLIPIIVIFFIFLYLYY